MYSYDDETRHVIAFDKFQRDKKYKEQIIQEIITAICAMLNSNGGKVVIDIDSDDNDMPLVSSHMLLMRILEQSMISIIGIQQTISNINFQADNASIVIVVQKTYSLVTTNYHLYLPSETQVVHLSSREPPEKVVHNIINRKVILEPVQIGSHCQIFCKDKICGIHESKTVQLKHLEAHATKRTTLADRMVGKGNKFSVYVSGHANLKGGHIYYGISDKGVVIGEIIKNEEEKGEITKKVEKAIKKMIWSERIGQLKQGEHWDIFFVPVLDKNSKPTPSTFVIVVYIAPCPGGVFTEEPECYEMVDGKVRKMSFFTWKKRISSQIEFVHVSSHFKRIAWRSALVRNICITSNDVLNQCVNNGKSIASISTNLEEIYPDQKVELKLLVLTKRVKVYNCSNHFSMVKRLLEEYNKLLKETTEFNIFDAIQVYLKAASYRAQRDHKALSNILPGALDKAERIEPGLISAAIYLLVATLKTFPETKDSQTRVLQSRTVADFSVLALEHLQYVRDSPRVKADMEQKCHMTLALFYLRCDICGNLTREDFDSESLQRAKCCLMAVQESIDAGNKMTIYREIGFNIVKSIYCYRYSQVQSDTKALLREAFDLSKRAERLASEYKFADLLNWARASMALYTESLVRTHLKSLSKRAIAHSLAFSKEDASKSL